MHRSEMVDLLRAGVPPITGVWADFGAGTGNFTVALQQLLPDDSTFIAIDKRQRDLSALQQRWSGDNLHIIQHDMTNPVHVPPLNGALMANSLHWNRAQIKILRHIKSYLRPEGILIIVEYDVQEARTYIPFPVPFVAFEQLARTVGFTAIRQVGFRRSPRGDASMYAASATVPSSMMVARQ